VAVVVRASPSRVVVIVVTVPLGVGAAPSDHPARCVLLVPTSRSAAAARAVAAPTSMTVSWLAAPSFAMQKIHPTSPNPTLMPPSSATGWGGTREARKRSRLIYRRSPFPRHLPCFPFPRVDHARSFLLPSPPPAGILHPRRLPAVPASRAPHLPVLFPRQSHLFIPQPAALAPGAPPLRLPVFELPSGPRTIDILPSAVHQFDALSFARKGVRIEVDIFANSAADSFTLYRKMRAYDDLASFNGLYLYDFLFMPAIIAAAASHQAFGVFVVPVLPDQPPLIFPVVKSQTSIKPGIPWFSFLLQHSLLTFNISRGVLSGAGAQLGGSSGVIAVLAQFGRNGRFKPSRGPCKEKSFDVFPIRGWPPYRQLMPVAQMWPRCSPLADSVAPILANDTSQPLPPIVVPACDPPMTLPPSPFNVSMVQRWASDYPFPRVFHLGLSAMNQSLDPFMGQRVHPVPQDDRKASEEDRMTARSKFVASKGRGNMDGPRPHRPFTNTRDLPWGLARKHHYKPSPEMRLTSDLSASFGESPSVNQGTWSPHMRRVHFAPSMTRDMMAWLGSDGTISLKDVPKCFRTIKNNPALLHLFVYKLVTKAFGTEFWTDLANPFGWIASEWGGSASWLSSNGFCTSVGSTSRRLSSIILKSSTCLCAMRAPTLW
jgi:hypothetical protein